MLQLIVRFWLCDSVVYFPGNLEAQVGCSALYELAVLAHTSNLSTGAAEDAGLEI